MIDSRTKIVPPQAAVSRWKCAQSKPVVVTGCFDPLVASHVRRLNEIAGPGGKLMILVTSFADSMLPLDARVRLLAALRFVDSVVPCGEGDAEAVLAGLGSADIVREEAGDCLRRLELEHHVRERKNAR